MSAVCCALTLSSPSLLHPLCAALPSPPPLSTDVYKEYVNKKIGDVVGYVNKAGSAAEGVIGKRGGLFGTHDKSLRGFIANLKEFVGAEVQGTVSALCC